MLLGVYGGLCVIIGVCGRMCVDINMTVLVVDTSQFAVEGCG